MLANFLIGLREGLEASLVVAILAAYLVRTKRRDQLRWLWSGVAAALVLSLAVAGALTLTSRSLTFTAQELFGGFASLLAVALVTWMVFWMRKVARGLKGELQAQVDQALATSGLAMAIVGLVSVGREGLETSLFLWTSTKTVGNPALALIGALLGLITSATAGWFFYRGALKLNLAKFFKWSGAALIVVAAGVLAYGIHDLQEAQFLPGLNNLAFDVSSTVDPNGWIGVLLKGTVGFTPVTTWLQAIAWLIYLPLVLFAFFRPTKTKTKTNNVPAARVPVSS